MAYCPIIGTAYVHTVIDDHSRLAYAEIHNDEKWLASFTSAQGGGNGVGSTLLAGQEPIPRRRRGCWRTW